jgi:uncharacterized protein YdeI (YjbR/CyaY-like superfamily)
VPVKRGSESAPIFFKGSAEYRAWLEKNHDTAGELWIGFWRKSTGKPSMTWKECVDESLCFGWIDGIRKTVDDTAYKQRVTPRRSTSMWSQTNVRRVGELTIEGRMRPTGIAAFEKRDPKKTYSGTTFDRIPLGPAEEAQLRKNRKAAAFWDAQPPGYRKLAGWFVMSAKREETRQRRLKTLIRDSAAGRRLAGLAPKKPGRPDSR